MDKSQLERITGHRVSLRLVRPEDAAYVFALRSDPAYNTHLSEVTGTVEDQRVWIESYKAREEALAELYYVIERLDDGRRCGLVRIYNIKSDHFTWGSWILDQSKPAKAALDSAVLVYTVGFDLLGLQKSIFDVRRENVRTLAFHRRFGAIEMKSDETDTFFRFSKADYEKRRAGYQAALVTDQRGLSK